MSNVKFNALASLALLAGAPVVAQAAMVEMTETQMADVNGQGLVTGFITGAFGLPDPFPVPGFTNIGQTLGLASGPDFVDGFSDGVGDVGASLGSDVASVALMGPFRALGLIGQGKSTALDFLFFPISAPLDVAGNVFGALDNGVVGTSSRILTAPLNAVFGPINRYVDGVTGRFEATVDGAAYAVTEVKGALITNAFAGASAAAGQNGLNFTSRVFGRISQAQAGLTTNRLTALSGKYGY